MIKIDTRYLEKVLKTHRTSSYGCEIIKNLRKLFPQIFLFRADWVYASKFIILYPFSCSNCNLIFLFQPLFL